jgi:hypothetical protein
VVLNEEAPPIAVQEATEDVDCVVDCAVDCAVEDVACRARLRFS